jgi:hypothetical protein
MRNSINIETNSILEFILETKRNGWLKYIQFYIHYFFDKPKTYPSVFIYEFTFRVTKEENSEKDI